MSRRPLLMLVVIVVLLAAGCGGGPSADLDRARDPAAVEAGEALYEANCAACHGSDLQGGRAPGGARAPSLAAKVGPDDVILIEIVKRGRGLSMPSFGTQLTEDEIVSIIDYVRTIQAGELTD